VVRVAAFGAYCVGDVEIGLALVAATPSATWVADINQVPNRPKLGAETS